MNTGENLVQYVYAWPDSTWCYADEYSDLEDAWKGDDYVVLAFYQPLLVNEIEECVAKYFGGV